MRCVPSKIRWLPLLLTFAAVPALAQLELADEVSKALAEWKDKH
jgi:hypothetical protein